MRRSVTQFTGGFGRVMPGRSRGTHTRSAPGWIVQCTGVGNETDSPSMPTGMCGASARISISLAASTLSPAAHAAEQADSLPRASHPDPHNAEDAAI